MVQTPPPGRTSSTMKSSYLLFIFPPGSPFDSRYTACGIKKFPVSLPLALIPQECPNDTEACVKLASFLGLGADNPDFRVCLECKLGYPIYEVQFLIVVKV